MRIVVGVLIDAVSLNKAAATAVAAVDLMTANVILIDVILIAADVVLIAADVVLIAADVVLIAADVVLIAADVVLIAADISKSALALVLAVAFIAVGANMLPAFAVTNNDVLLAPAIVLITVVVF